MREEVIPMTDEQILAQAAEILADPDKFRNGVAYAQTAQRTLTAASRLK